MNWSCIPFQFSLRFNQRPNGAQTQLLRFQVRIPSNDLHHEKHKNHTRTLNYAMEGRHHRSVSFSSPPCAVHSTGI